MKKFLILTVVLLGVSLSQAMAQVTANLNITLSPVLSITISGAEVPVTFTTAAHYTGGVTAAVDNQLTITSSKGYVVTAHAGTIEGADAISAGAGSVKISTEFGTGNMGNTAGVTPGVAVVLGANQLGAATVFTSTNSSMDGAEASNKLKVTYLVGSESEFAGKFGTGNKIPVVYTVTQP